MKRKYKISRKLIFFVCISIALIFIFDGTITYLYCHNIMLEQEFKSEDEKSALISNQLSTIVSDIKQYALIVAVDDEVQKFMAEKEYDKAKLRQALSMFEVQNDYIFNIVIRNFKDILLSSSMINAGINEKTYLTFFKNTLIHDIDSRTSKLFLPETTIINKLNYKTEVLTYVVNVMSMDKYKVAVGQIVINIDYDKLLATIKKNIDASNLNNFYWMSDKKTFLYQANDENDYFDRNSLEKYISQTEPHKTASFESGTNYIVVDRTSEVGWIIITTRSLKMIGSRLNFLVLFFIVSTFLFIIVTVICIGPIINRIIKPITIITNSMNNVKMGNFNDLIKINTKDEFQILAEGYNSMMSRIKIYVTETIKTEQEKKDLEMSLLLAQINPHFIYNTLNTIIYLAYEKDTESIAEMTRSFIAMLQDTAKINEQGLFVTLEQELEVVKNYVKIQKYRYPERFDVTYSVDEALLNSKIPRSILQPIIENSLLHGIIGEKQYGTIALCIWRQENIIMCSIEDNGVGMEEEEISKIMNGLSRNKSANTYSIGLRNVINRLDNMYGKQYVFKLESRKNAYTRFIIGFPE